MEIKENYSLKHLNTFGIQVISRYYSSFTTVDELQQLIHFNKEESPVIIGGGSNILFTKNVNTLTAKNEIGGIKVTGNDNDYVYVTCGAGENWHKFVLYCIQNNYGGVENLSLIPGSVGASPMQNIGAYGVEIKDIFHQLTAWHIRNKQLVTFNTGDCEFGYRESVFKRKLKGQYIICDVTFRLQKVPEYKITYGAIQHQLESMGIKELSIKAISDAVIAIRQSKLPDPLQIGNAGSFFKNPTITMQLYEKIKSKFAEVVAYPAGNEMKIAAGWLIEQCGWKGYRKGDAGCHAKQALVLVNYGNASGTEIFNLSEQILTSVYDKFGIQLEREVNIL